MSRGGSRWLGVFFAAVAVAAPLHAQALQYLRADMQMSGGALASPATGALYVSGSAARIEISMDGQNVIILGDPSTGSMNILMPDQGIYMPLSAGMSPVSVPPVAGYNPADPCSSGEVTNCVSLGTEQVNGYDAAVWQYDSNNETWTAWIATEFSFPVRLVGSDGTTTDFTNIAMEPQDASLFEIPSNLQPMPGLGGFAGAFGGGGGGGGAAPPSGNAAPGGFAFPPGFDPAAFGVDPAALADLAASGGIPVPSPFEGGDGWQVTFTVTASGERTGNDQSGSGIDEWSEMYSMEYTVSVPLNYGTPAAPLGPGPRWQLVPGIGSERGNAAEISFVGQSEYHSEGTHVEECSIVGGPYSWNRTTAGSLDFSGGPASSDNPAALMAVAFWQLSPDGQTYDLSVGLGGEATEVTEGVSNYGSCEGAPATSEPIDETASRSYSGVIGITGEPLPGARQTISGSRTMPYQLEFGGFSGKVDALVEWTISEI